MDGNKTPLVGIVIAIAIVILGALAFLVPQVQMPKDEAMHDETMQKEEGMMEDEMMKDDTMMSPEEGAMMQKGSYESYAPEKLARANDGDVVLFFRASWCPTCRALDADIKAHLGDIPESLTILDVNYDKETALKQKYGVTYQHTLVQVDTAGNLIAKWESSPTLAALTTKVQ